MPVLSLACSRCGASLDIAPDQERFACGYCGASLMVERRGGTVCLHLLADAIGKVQVGTDRTAAELALVRLRNELGLCRTHWNQTDEKLSLEKPSSDGPQLLILGLTIAALVMAVTGIADLIQKDFGAGFFWLFVAAVFAMLTRMVTRSLAKAQADFATRRGAAWAPYRERLAWLEEQIAKNRRVVEE